MPEEDGMDEEIIGAHASCLWLCLRLIRPVVGCSTKTTYGRMGICKEGIISDLLFLRLAGLLGSLVFRPLLPISLMR